MVSPIIGVITCKQLVYPVIMDLPYAQTVKWIAVRGFEHRRFISSSLYLFIFFLSFFLLLFFLSSGYNCLAFTRGRFVFAPIWSPILSAVRLEIYCRRFESIYLCIYVRWCLRGFLFLFFVSRFLRGVVKSNRTSWRRNCDDRNDCLFISEIFIHILLCNYNSDNFLKFRKETFFFKIKSNSSFAWTNHCNFSFFFNMKYIEYYFVKN